MMKAENYYTRAALKREARQKQVHRNIALLVFSIVLILFLVLFITSISTQASDREHMPSYKYFRSIQISSGDTLWSIAEENMDTHYKHTSDYVAEVKRMNSLDTDKIVAGSYLIIPYYSTEFVGSDTYVTREAYFFTSFSTALTEILLFCKERNSAFSLPSAGMI